MKPGNHQIRERAYYIWEGEGRVFGRADEHWFRAEAECSAKAVEQIAAAPLTVQPSAPLMSDAPSPAKALKPRSARAAGAGARAVAAKADDATRVVEKAAVKAAPNKGTAAKSAATKTAAAKTSAVKSAAGKAKSAARSTGSGISLH